MILIDKLYANKGRLCDIVRTTSIEYDEGIKCVFFTRYARDQQFRLPIEMFEKNFEEIPNGYK